MSILSASASNNTESETSKTAPVLYKRTGDNLDLAWTWNSLADKNNLKKVTCDFCLLETNGGISRARRHQIGHQKGVRKDVVTCTKTPNDVILKLKEAEEKKIAAKKACFEEVHEDETIELEEINRIQKGKRSSEELSLPTPTTKKNIKEPLDAMFYRKPELTLGEGKQTSINDACMNDACDKEAREETCQYIAQFFYRNGIAFNVAKTKSFKLMVEAIGNYGPHLNPPSYYELRNPMLNKELDHTKEMLKPNRDQQEKYGCSIMLDGWTDTKSRTLINCLVNSLAGTMFVKSVNASSYMKTGDTLFQLLDSFVEEIGERNVVQLITDNGSNYVLAGRLLTAKRLNIFWTPCAAHCLDLMLEDIGKIPKVKRVIQKSVSLVGFIYNHSLVLNLMRVKTKSELIRAGVTRFVTNFLTLQRLHKLKVKLRTMFSSEEWLNLNASKDSKGKKASSIVFQVSFWDDIVYTLKAMGPLVKVLRIVKNEKKPAMGFIYKAMEDAKDAIQRSFNNNESKYKEIIDIVDKRWDILLHHPLHATGYYLNPQYFYTNPEIENDAKLLDGLYKCFKKLSKSVEDEILLMNELSKYKMGSGHFSLSVAIRQRQDLAPAEWWKRYGAQTPNLQHLAIKILSLTCSSSRCERNWSTFEHIHSKKRNKLEHDMLQDLVFIKYNQNLKERYDCDDEIDPVVMEDINITADMWLLGDEAQVDVNKGQNDLFFVDSDLTWLDVDIAKDASEPIKYTRRRTSMQKAKTSRSSFKAKAKVVAPVVEDDGDLEYIGEDEEGDEESEEYIGDDDDV